MLTIPFVKQPDEVSCALACYTMVAKYFLPEVSLENIAEISHWEKGYVSWAYKFWLWIMERGVSITDYDLIDAVTWAEEGLPGLKKSIGEKEYEFYIKNTKDLESYSEDIKKVLNSSNFTYNRQKPTFEILEKAVAENKVCEAVIDSRDLNDKEGFSLHRVVVLGFDNDEIAFHDPMYGPNVRVGKSKFKEAWLERVETPELCIYSK